MSPASARAASMESTTIFEVEIVSLSTSRASGVNAPIALICVPGFMWRPLKTGVFDVVAVTMISDS